MTATPSAPTEGATAPVAVVASDDQDDVPLDLDRYRALLAAVLADEGAAGPGEAHLAMVGAGTIARLNESHLGSDGPTDVLSFPLDGVGPLAGGDYRMVGDVVVCPSVARDQAPAHAGSTEAELALLVVHGGLHLCGHDHAEAMDRDRMWSRERELLDRWWGPLPRDPWGTR